MARTLASFSFAAKLLATVKNVWDSAGINKEAAAEQGESLGFATAFANGTGANQADTIWSSGNRALSSGANESLDLYDLGTIDLGAGAGKDALGQSVANVEIVGLLIVHKSGTGTLLVGGGGATTAWNSMFNGDDDAQLVVKPGGRVLVLCPPDPAYAVADTTNHTLKMEASGGAVTYSITVLSRSA